MKVIGLTGGVGCGKSTVAKVIEEHFNAVVLIADDIGFDLMKPEQACYKDIVASFGEEVVLEDGTLDRRGLAAIVFSDEEKLARLNGIIHPRVREYIDAEIEKLAESKKVKYLFVESAIILECGYDNMCDEFWYVSAPLEERKCRLKASRGYSDEKIESIMSNQKDEMQFRNQCDVVIENDGDLEKIFSQLKILLV